MTALGGAYFAYPIDQRRQFASLAHLFDQIEKFEQMLLEHNVVDWVFDPGDAFNVAPGAEISDKIARINRAAHINSDLVVAFLPTNIASVGVPMEIDRAVSQGKRVIVFSNAPSWMLIYPGEQVVRYNDWDDDSLKDALLTASTMAPRPTQRAVEDLPVVVHNEGCLPRRAYEDDAGLDLVVSQDTVLLPGEFTDVPCGVSVELPGWTWGLVTGRSSALRKRGLLVHSGVIDAGYRGPLFAGAWNMTDEPVTVMAGERIAQLIVINNATRYVEPIRAMALTQSPRGRNGFGSTGA